MALLEEFCHRDGHCGFKSSSQALCHFLFLLCEDPDVELSVPLQNLVSLCAAMLSAIMIMAKPLKYKKALIKCFPFYKSCHGHGLFTSIDLRVLVYGFHDKFILNN